MENSIKETVSNRPYIIFLSIIAAISGLLFGFDTGVINGALPYISSFFHIFEKNSYYVFGILSVHGTFLKELIVSTVPLGALIGAIVSSVASRKFGRRWSILITAILFFIGTFLAGSALSVNVLLCGRLLMGFAIGLSAMIVPMYLSEVSPSKIRGSVVFLYQMAITIGILMAFVIDYAFHAHADWRSMFYVGLIPSTVLGIGMLFLPHSPRWLVLKGRDKKAHATLKKLRGHIEVKEELEEIQASVKHAHGGLKLLFSKKLRPLVLIAFGLFVFQQLTGINTIFYYAPAVFKASGFHGNSASILAAVSTGVVNVLATILGIWLVDKIGRKKLLYIGLMGIVICHLILGSDYHHFFGMNTEWLSLVTVLIFIVFFAMSISGIAYIMMSELFPLNVRGAGMAIASCANWGFNFLVSSTFLSIAQAIGFGNVYWLYAGFTFIAIIFTYKLVPETKNVSLEHIEQNLYNGVRSRDLGKIN